MESEGIKGDEQTGFREGLLTIDCRLLVPVLYYSQIGAQFNLIYINDISGLQICQRYSVDKFQNTPPWTDTLFGTEMMC